MTARDALHDAEILDSLADRFGLADRVVDEAAVANSVGRFAERGITLPTFAELADPATIDPGRVGDADPQGNDPRNLWRNHWYNDVSGQRVAVPEHVVIPPSLSGVESPIIVVFGDRFPMITAHKVLAAYACLAPRIVTGQFDPTRHRAIWPSTGNYARGGIAISRIMASRGVAILPEGMSRERFDWLERWCENPAEDVIRTVGTESNVKEIYDACNELAKDPANFVLNQFCEFGNHLAHYEVTGRALAARVRARPPRPRRTCDWPAFVSATGSAGTIAAGDRLKDTYGTRIVAVEALECPTLLENGFGEHNIQGIGDKHVPLIHNVMNTDVGGGGERPGDRPPAGHVQHRRGSRLPRRSPAGAPGRAPARCATSASRRSATCSPPSPRPSCSTSDRTTPSSPSPPTGRRCTRASGRRSPPATSAAASPTSTPPRSAGEHLANVPTAHALECTERVRNRIFNLGYYTWVEQQGTPVDAVRGSPLRRLLDRSAPVPGRVG